MKRVSFLISILVTSLLLLVNCGGGGGGDYDDNNPPIISYTEPTVILQGSNFDPLDGVTAWDDIDGDITDEIVIVSNDVNTSAVGIYTVIYRVADTAGNITTATRSVSVIVLNPDDLPVDSGSAIDGTALGCDPASVDANGSTDANEFAADKPFKKNVSSSTDDVASRKLQTSHNTIKRLDMVMYETNAAGETNTSSRYHPILATYLEHVEGSDYEMGDGSADIGDPDNVDKVVASISRDNGKTWKDYNVSNTTGKSSIEVVWNGQTIAYPGDAQKPTMAISGQYVLVAWNDKYCPSGNPFNLDGNSTDGYPDDAFAVNGPQNYIDYEGVVAPNGKRVYQVPFSCVWTARGIIDETSGEIRWHAPMQLTSGTRDSNKIWVAGSPAGFALAWQEDVLGLKQGEGAGPGDGWSGATTNRGTDIWYTSIKMADFAAEDGLEDGKPKSAYNFHYPVRITDNEQCQDTDKKIYCKYFCDTYGTVTSEKGNLSGDTVTRCLTYDIDMLTNTVSVLDGDTGASRSALKILKTNAGGEYVVVFGYEETKALTIKISGEGEQDQGEIPTDIEAEGKSVYFESFDFNAIDAFDESNISTIATTPMPIVSAGNIINTKAPAQDDPEHMIYENARRLVIGTQIDSCDAAGEGNITFAILYKQSFEVQGASSDMFVRTNRGFTYDTFEALNGLEVTNVSAQNYRVTELPTDYVVDWSPENLDDNTYENGEENTFSPRIFLRGGNIYVGFEYTPNDTKTSQGNFPSNFHTHRFIDGVWQGPQNITQVTEGHVTTVDARFFTTPKGSYDATGLESDKSNPNVLFVTWGTLVNGIEADLFFRRSADNGESWEEEQNLSSISGTVVQEKEVESFASPDGKTIYNVWLQQSENEPMGPASENDGDIWLGLDTWFGRVDYNVSILPAP
ncbi:choice-of-anchor O protein [Sulfurovum sp. ST-21]|uniref:DUF5011 domain-containing protein n=1 Tax=Sulfurovum indicum TaxID=2779528 RepID=A0A7M1S6S4_9BACT|nr:choice-of-anchor O protein [Sulfurovum indicum]QOR62854.1 DUF5011 domain-containing protein [Sulfurovum indicum]